MTIDNHPLTPKPVDDRGTGFGCHQVLPVDREAANALVIECALPWEYYEIFGIAFTRHREQAERGLREALELLQRVLSETVGAPVGGGDGCTYVVKTLSGKTFNDLHAFTARKALDTRP